MDIRYSIKLDNGARYEAKGPALPDLAVGDIAVFRRDIGLDAGEVVSIGGEVPEQESESCYALQRKATLHELATINENAMRAKNSLRTAEKFVEQLNLPMKLLNAHYSLDNKLLTIQFTADGRVDFRELVKELSHALNVRLELRQIGVRDETVIYGGIGVCGQMLCCCRFLRDFSSINVRMAKEQDLSLTPATISGTCGRLKCCLKFEHAGYLELEKGMPRRGDWCECPSGCGRVCDRNLLTRKVTVQTEDGATNRYDVDQIHSIGRRPCAPPATGNNSAPQQAPANASSRKNNNASGHSNNRKNNRPGDRPHGAPQEKRNPAEGEAHRKSDAERSTPEKQ
ncbi:MAG: regulatory iron-sulfur-containing complex subunit RicT [Victivallaceae bacterium]|nr:regulatory iron-sulfur-containing complex subunit RicT [Victivallaceae bacterium]